MRHSVLILVGVVCFSGFVCREAPDAQQTRLDQARRENALLFWKRVRAATEARVGGDCRNATALYEEALAIVPGHEDSLYYSGQCERQLGHPEEARSILERLVRANPVSARGHLALASLLASPLATEPMDLPGAEAHLRRAHEINGEETGTMVHLGEVLVVEGKTPEAREWFEAALRTNAKSIEAAFLLGYLAWARGDLVSAHAAAEGAVKAAKVEGPVRGVLSEGDRKDTTSKVAPPIASPLGRTLFGDEATFIREALKEGRVPSNAEFVAAWRAVRTRQDSCEERAADGSRQRRPAASAQSIRRPTTDRRV